MKSNRQFILAKYMFFLTDIIFGFACFCILKAARNYSNYRQLKKVSNYGKNLYLGNDFSVFNLGGNITFGDDVSIMNRCQMASYSLGSIRIGNNCFIGDNVKIDSDKAKITIGDDSLIAEDVVIRASNHGMRVGKLMRLQDNVCRDIHVGHDVWIGRGVTVLSGSNIENGCVIGANSVVRGVVKAGGIYGGIPIKKIRDRN